ncbi:MAG TPA: PilZ domain-containing protein [Candidatus Acidoferrum sp.]|nr:PilZ domain-containing protein [Candidatus Acidoferrum sp.]
MRRSGRIAKQVPIVLLGTDTSGRVFSEETHTLVLSRHGAGILSRNKFAPDEVLTMREADSGREADIRLVGRLGEEPGGNVYGVTFCDPNLDFWKIEFPPPPEPVIEHPGVDLECCFCNERAHVRQTEIESDVLITSQTVLRYCQSCGLTTAWKKSTGSPPAPRPKPAPVPDPPRESLPALAALPPTFLAAPAAPKSAYAASNILDDFVSSAELPPVPAAIAVAVKEAPPLPTAPSQPKFAAGGKVNLRRHVRTRVHFTACVRLSLTSEDIVECDNVSKGGLSFRSLKRYDENAAIEVAVPYYPGQPSLFVRARIVRVEELPALHVFRYGVAYA